MTLFFKHVVNINFEEGGLFGPTSGYYCTLEQQGHLVLHGHAIICKVSELNLFKRILQQLKQLLAILLQNVSSLPILPPPTCDNCTKENCPTCLTYSKWFLQYQHTIDNLAKFESSCLNNKFKQCKARFPRKCFPESVGEKWLNDVSPALTYLVHGNTDVTSLMSGTAMKAAVIYIADYITKTSLKTHVVFDCIRAIFDKSTESYDQSRFIEKA
ncbi:hypothetical protein BT96DRAFT_956248 [Gymnopus androsaceus JB14]|uniref:Uncharacterized protein n=1 Tax=Gymnopus androsaceus JB14 TaxID=1447944 RepID=A0A6A4I103_9AGAR|nr:hypothetical protein BT96DRAFT_956248 [Gymnopus androsaceus JB14]